MTERDSPIDQVLETARAALHSRRASLLERVQRVAVALEAYQRAGEAQIAQRFAAEHALSRPATAALSPERAAELLEAAVQALPELSARPPVSAPAASAPAASAPAASSPATSASASEATELPQGDDRAPRFPLLTSAVFHAKIVVIGALSGRDRSPVLPPELGAQVEWIDTERDGAHAIGNLPQRVRQGRVAGVVILDRVVQHRHTEPVVAAARDAGVPIAFAGQGGKASFIRALEQLEATLASRL